jgi:hypothetical protein
MFRSVGESRVAEAEFPSLLNGNSSRAPVAVAEPTKVEENLAHSELTPTEERAYMLRLKISGSR